MTLDSTFTSAPAHGSRARLMEQSSALRLAGGMFLGMGTAFIAVTMLAASIAPGYDFHAAAISDLGTIPETSVAVQRPSDRDRAVQRCHWVLPVSGLRQPAGWMVALFAVAGLGSLGAGVVPLSAGDAHSLFALLAFLFINLEAIAAARVVRGPLRLLRA